MNFLEKMPLKYKNISLEFVDIAKKIFGSNLMNITLGGSGGKGNIIDGWSDLDFYIILKVYDINEVSEFMDAINSLSIHTGTTFYSYYELKNNIIDNKTKITIYEKQTYSVNPTLYGNDLFNTISYDVVKRNDIDNFPNILHDVRRRFIQLNYSDNAVDKVYIKKLLVLAKCILNYYDIFSYGYITTFDRLSKFFIECDFLTEPTDFDILNVIKNLDDSKEAVLNYTNLIMRFISDYMFKEE